MSAARIPPDGDVLEVSEQEVVDSSTILYGGRYELLSLIGAGAYGSVYRARDTELDEVVAVKVLRYEHLTQNDTLARFRREVRLARRVAHWNVARTFDIGRHDGERFLTMEYIKGQPLTRFCPVGSSTQELLPIRLVIDIATQLCAGLGALHAAGIVHRDMKTDNVLVSHDARVAITDFGIARALEGGDAEATGSGQLVGTPAYMAPEQVLGAGPIDTRADLYALGIVLFQMLTGQLPFDSQSGLESALLRLYQQPRDPRAIRPQLPKSLAEVLLRCLAREPDERFQTADELATALGGERPSGPDLADFLKSYGPGQRSAPIISVGPPHGAAMDPTLVGFAQDATMTGPAEPPLPQIDVVPQVRQLSLAVLLFRSICAPADAYLAHGLTEELIERLSESEGLRVIPYSVVRDLPNELRDSAEIGQKLAVKVVLDGSLRVTASGLSATVRLIDLDSKLQFAARRFERSDRNILALSIEVAHCIGELLTIRLEASRGSLVDDPVAVDLYLRARHQHHRMTRDTTEQSIVLLEQALARLPDEPTLLTGLAHVLARHWFFAGAGAGERAMQVALRAVELAPKSGEAHLALSAVLVHANRFEEAATELRRALGLSPKLPEAHELVGQLLSETGPLDLAVRHLNYALTIDRSIPRIRMSLGRTAMLEGQVENALAMMSLEGVSAEYLHIGWVGMTRLLSWMRDRDRARALLHSPTAQAPEVQDVLPRLAHIAGEREVSLTEYIPYFYRLSAASHRSQQFGQQVSIEYYCLGHKYDAALHILREASEGGLADIMWVDRCPLLAPLREMKDFSAVRAPIANQAQRIRRAFGLKSGASL